MNFIDELILTGYKVEYVDLREPKPRQHYTTIAVYNSDTVKAVNKLGIAMQDYVINQFNKGGYYILNIEKEHKQVVNIDIGELFVQNKIKSILQAEGITNSL